MENLESEIILGRNNLVSVIVAVFNSEKYIGQAIESIINSTYSHFELIIIDDGSTDKSLEIIRTYEKLDPRIKVTVNKTNEGISKSRNQGLKIAEGEYIAVMDSDDISVDDRLAKQVEYMNNNPDTLVLGGHLIMIDSDGNQIPCKWTFSKEVNRWDTLTKIAAVAHPCMMVRKSYLQSIGGYPEGYKNSVDRALFQKMALSPNFCMRNLNDVLVKYRVHSMGTSVKDKELQQSNSKKIRKQALEKLINQSIPSDVFDVLFGHPPESIPVNLSRESFKLFEKLLINYYRTFKPSNEDWTYAKKDFVRRADKLLQNQKKENIRLYAKLFLYYPQFIMRKLYKFLIRHLVSFKNNYFG